MKKYIIVIIIMLYCIIDVGTAKAESYDRTIDYRYRQQCVTNDSNEYTFISNYTEWSTGNDMDSFENTETSTLVFTRYGDGTTSPTTMSAVNIISAENGDFMFKGHMVSGTTGFRKFTLNEVDVDYIYKYPTSTVDTDYTVTYTFDSDMGSSYTYIVVKIMGIQRAGDGTTYTQLDSQVYGDTLGNNGATKVFGDSTTITGSNGYNYSGFNIRVEAHIGSWANVYTNDTLWNLWNMTTSLDTITPDIDYGAQLDNINGTLSSIYSSITGGFTSISNAITQLPITIANAVKNLFVYDDWQDDIEDIANDIQIPYLQQITQAFADVLEQFEWYQPEHTFTIKIPYGNQYLVNQTYDLQTITNVQIIGQYKLIDLIHVMVKFTSFAYVIALLSKIFEIFGFHYWEYLNPIIQKAGGVDE